MPDLPTGTYTVSVPQPAGFGDGPDSPGSAGGTPTRPNTIAGIELTAGEKGDGYTFGLTRASIAGHVCVDVDGDGRRGPGDGAIGGVPVAVTGSDVNGVAVTRSVTTGPDGAFVVDGLLQGTYTVAETQPAGYLDGPDRPGSAGGSATPPDTIERVALAAGSDAVDYDFCEKGSALGGTVVDEDGAGVADVPVTVGGTTPTASRSTAPPGPTRTGPGQCRTCRPVRTP